MEIQVNDIVEFAGYQNLNGAEEILKQGQKVKVIEIVPTEKGNCYNVYPVREDGELEEEGDQIFENEIFDPASEAAIIAENNELNAANHTENSDEEEDNLPDIDDTEIEHDPAVEELIRGTNNLTDLAYDLYAEHEESYYKLGGILIDIKRNKVHVQEGYEDNTKGFVEYVQDFIGPRQRAIYYIMSIYRELREINVTSKELKGIGWTKARLIKEAKGREKKLEFMEKAKGMSRQELQDWLDEREERRENRKVRFSFSVLPDAAEVINQAMEAVSFEAENNKNKAFELICAHYLATTE